MSTVFSNQTALRSSLALALSFAAAWACAAPQTPAVGETQVQVLPRVVVTAKSLPANAVVQLPRVVVTGTSNNNQAALPQSQAVVLAKPQARRI